VKDLDWCLLCKPNPKWQIQTEIDEDRIDMQIAMLFHYNMDLAAVHWWIGGNHVGTSRDHHALLHQVKDLVPPKVLWNLWHILLDGCPAKFNTEGSHREFLQMLAYGNHPSMT
jgi:hypothetical protein